MKFLVSPLFGYLLLQAGGLMVVQRHLTGRSRTVTRWLLLLTLLLAMLSTPLSRKGLRASLTLPPTTNLAVAPAFIFVLGGGYEPGAIPDEDVLVMESQWRVLHAVSLWRRYPITRMVFAGAADTYEGRRAADRLVQLMAETARNRGVPTAAIMLEPRSRNTREHPIEALKLSGITPSVPIGVVTSGWHVRRAQQEFSRYFRQVQIYPVPLMPRPVDWQDFVPDAESLSLNTTLLREWVGLGWYSLLNMRR